MNEGDLAPQVLPLPPSFLPETERLALVPWMEAHCRRLDETRRMSTFCRWAKNPPGAGALLERVRTLFETRWRMQIVPTRVTCRVREHRAALRPHMAPPNDTYALSVPLVPECRMSPLHVDGRGLFFAAPGEAIVMSGSKRLHWRAPNPGPTVYWLVIFCSEHPAARYRRIEGAQQG